MLGVVLAVLAVASIVLGTIGFIQRARVTGSGASFGDALYAALALFTFEGGSVTPPVPWALQVARFLAPAVTAYAAVIAAAAIFRDRAAVLRARWMRGDRVLVCGLGRIGALVAREFRTQGVRVVAIERDPENVAVAEAREQGIVVLIGDATDRSLLRKAGVASARYLFAVSGNDEENLKVTTAAGELVGDRPRPLRCFVHVLDPGLLNLLLESTVGGREAARLQVEPFNTADRGARVLLERYPVVTDGARRPPAVHLVIVGLGQMGGRLLIEAARQWRDAFGRGARKLRVTVVDRRASRHVALLRQRYPRLDDVCRVVSRDFEVESAEFHRGAFLGRRRGEVTRAFVCLGDDARGLSAGATLRRRLPASDQPIVVRTTQEGGPASLMLRVPGGPLEGVEVFGLLELVCRPDVLLRGTPENLGRAIHAGYVRSQRRLGHTAAENPSMAPWDELPEGLRESNRRQADSIREKLAAVGCVLEPLTDWDARPLRFRKAEVEVMAKMEHDRWWAERLSEGWTPAPEKSVERKESPYLVPWEQLPEEVRDYDRDAVRNIPSVLADAGYAVVRVKAAARG